MALNESIRGGIRGGVLLFPVYEKRSSVFVDYAKKLGLIVHVNLEGGEGAVMLVQAGEAVSRSNDGGLCFRWREADAYEVELTELTLTVGPCGFSFPGLEALEVGDYFWVIVPGFGNPRVTLRTSFLVLEGGYVIGVGDGLVIPLGGIGGVRQINPSIMAGQALATAAAGGPIDVILGFLKGTVA